ncbi:MAG: response regulator transcription factor [Thermoleophilia bacterium]|nr:response regulator transcription factor [Thermoleophilia bacterium]
MSSSSTLGAILPESTPIRVMIADDHELTRSGVKHALDRADDIEVVAEASDGRSALATLEHNAVDVLLLDIRMPHLDGMACLDQVVTRWPEVAVLMLSIEDDRRVALDALQRGATGYIVKTIRPADLAATIRQAILGSVLMGGAAVAHVAATESHRPADDLTERELEILRHLALGQSNADIGDALCIAPKTVKYHLTNVYAKLGVANRTEAAAYALRHGLGD